MLPEWEISAFFFFWVTPRSREICNIFLYGEHKDNSVFFPVWLTEICFIIDDISGKFLLASEFTTSNVKVWKMWIKFLLYLSINLGRIFHKVFLHLFFFPFNSPCFWCQALYLGAWYHNYGIMERQASLKDGCISQWTVSGSGHCLSHDSRWVGIVGSKSISESHSFMAQLTIM